MIEPNGEALRLKANYRCEGCNEALIDGASPPAWLAFPKAGKKGSKSAADYDILCRPCAVRERRIE